MVDLESRFELEGEKRRRIDITCSFEGRNAKCAIELKFKTKKQSAQDHGRIDCFVDLQNLELATRHDYQFGWFFMITDSTVYVNESNRGVGTVFTMHDGATTSENQLFHCPNSKGREDVKVQLKNAYTFKWERSGDWYFLAVPIPKTELQKTK